MKKNIQITTSRAGSQPFYCHIVGHPEAFPVVYAGGVVYAEILASLAYLYDIKFIYAEFPYWYGRNIADLGYTSVREITLDSMLADLQDVVAHCVSSGHIPSEGDTYSYAVAGGSQPGWLAIALKNTDPHCVALNLFATPVPGLKSEEWENEKNAYLAKNDLRSPSEQKFPLKNLENTGSGIRATFFIAESKVTVPNETLIEGYHRVHNPLFWKNPRCDDRVFWQGANVSKDFFQRFFEIMFTTNTDIFYPNGKILLIAGIHDFTIPYRAWMDFFNQKGAKLIHDNKYGMLFNYQDSQVRLICSLGGHLPHMLESETIKPANAPKSPISFIPDPSLVTAYIDWVSEIKKLPEARSSSAVGLLSSL